MASKKENPSDPMKLFEALLEESGKEQGGRKGNQPDPRKLLQAFLDGRIGEQVDRALADAEPITPDELLQELTEHYRAILQILKRTPADIRIAEENPQLLYLDGEEVDLDACLSGRRRNAREHLYAIDSLLGDLRESGMPEKEALSAVEAALRNP